MNSNALPPSRRDFISQATAGSVAAFFASGLETRAAVSVSKGSLLGFAAVPASTADTFVVPDGYRAEPLLSWGDPIVEEGPSFAQAQGAAEQLLQMGDNTDGMALFPVGDKGDRAVLAINNEYTNYGNLFGHGGKNMALADVEKAQAAHGVTVVELKREAEGWVVNLQGERNRRLTANTPMELVGPAAGHPLLLTEADPEGKLALGTFNNCANGQTPWGTYLTCEENFHGYFGSQLKGVKLRETDKLYGLSTKEEHYQWHQYDPRFDFGLNPNEPHRFGWVVEIDPHDPNSTPRKLTALGWIKHENAELLIARKLLLRGGA
ncbi:MAG: DUF839 domain-containing protein [Verrucomicrobiales bacterium]|nr:DUF839 domain-containing protein [Verrucomicrobiales bacterium]